MLSHLHFNRGQHLKGNCPKLWFQNTNILRDIYCAVLFLITQLCPTFCNPREGNPPGSSVHGDSPGKNTGVGFHALLQRIFPTQGSNPCLFSLPALAGGFFTTSATWEAHAILEIFFKSQFLYLFNKMSNIWIFSHITWKRDICILNFDFPTFLVFAVSSQV